MPESTAQRSAEAVPRHIAIIMDGNGRWARQRGLPRLRGHQVGADSVRAVMRACQDLGVKYLTLYAFSSENWIRPRSEVAGLMNLLVRSLAKEEAELHKYKIRLRMIGRIDGLPPPVRKKLQEVMDATRHHDRGHLILALNYGGRLELVDAIRAIGARIKRGQLDPAAIDEQTVAQHLYAPDVPDPDLMIRTSGEMRLSNFLLWQLSYAEFYITDILWPDFREAQLKAAIASYQARHRRFGDIK